MPNRLGDDHVAAWQLLVVRPQVEDDTVSRGHQVGHLLGLVRGEIEHLHPPGGDFLPVVVPVFVPVAQRDGAGPSR